MTREKKKAPPSTKGSQALARRQKRERAQQFVDGVWQNLNALNAAPQLKHKTYFESVENVDKKKKLEFQITTDREAPPGFEFIPTGHPELTQACKDRSRDQEAMIFIVSDSKDPNLLEHHMNRAGYHFRQTIVDQAREILQVTGQADHTAIPLKPNEPEPIPKSQDEINKQADAVLRDLFPRIPNTDRHEIIQHAFQKDGKFHGDYKVGMAKELSLARRVQLAALAHIRHTRTRYDKLLKETDWANARKAVEKPCLDIIVKWRGDEETGRDQLDEILREVIEISDTESDSEVDSSDTERGRLQTPGPQATGLAHSRQVSDTQASLRSAVIAGPPGPRRAPSVGLALTPSRQRGARAERKTARKAVLRFRRYAAAAEAIAEEPMDQHGRTNGLNRTVQVSTTQDTTSARAPALQHRVAQYQHEGDAVRPSDPAGKLRSIPGLGLGDGFHLGPSSPSTHHHQRGTQVGQANYFAPGSEIHRPKVPSSFSDRPPSNFAVSPIRSGLQDMLLPSIEPVSPGPRHVSQQLKRTIFTDTSQPVQDLQTGPRPLVPAGSSAVRDPSLGYDSLPESGLKRRRIATYFPDDFNPPSASTQSAPRVSRLMYSEVSQANPRGYVTPETSAYGHTGKYGSYPEQQLGTSFTESRRYVREDDSYRTRDRPVLVDGNSTPRQLRAIPRGTERIPDDAPLVHSRVRRAEPVYEMIYREQARDRDDYQLSLASKQPMLIRGPLESSSTNLQQIDSPYVAVPSSRRPHEDTRGAAQSWGTSLGHPRGAVPTVWPERNFDEVQSQPFRFEPPEALYERVPTNFDSAPNSVRQNPAHSDHIVHHQHDLQSQRGAVPILIRRRYGEQQVAPQYSDRLGPKRDGETQAASGSRSQNTIWVD